MSAVDQALSRRARVRAEDARAFLSLAKRQRHIAQVYRTWAREAEQAGKLDAYRRYAAEARRLFRDAKAHLRFARSRTYV